MSNLDPNNSWLNVTDEKQNAAVNNRYAQSNVEEIASEFVVDATLKNANTLDSSGYKFEPNKEKTHSERSAWH